MAEVVLLPLAKSTLGQLSSPAVKEFLLLWNSKKEIMKLEATVEAISLALQDAEKRQSTEHLVRGWLSRLRAVMYDVEDLLDVITARALSKESMTCNALKREVHLFFSRSNKAGFTYKITHEVMAIRESLDEIARDMGQFRFIANQYFDNSVKLPDRDATHSSIQAKYVIGRDRERDDIIEMLLSEDIGETLDHEGVSVIAIIGFGGLGKTTLVQHVYNDERVKKEFELCLWACINDLSNLEKVLIEIIASVEKKPCDLGLEKLQEKLREIIVGKKFLVVLDDVWDENELNWHRLKPLLDYGKVGSRVLVTTRSNTVARCLDASKQYPLGVLSEENAWSLFVKMTFDDGELGSHPELEPFIRQVIDRCGRVPLALIMVGRLLRHREKEERTWSQFLDNELREVLLNDDKNKIMQVLMVSYNDLPLPLKHCFAYCSLFPKDYEFDKDELIRLWLAQGFLGSSNHKKSLEEVGEKYFFYLVDRCFFQEVETLMTYDILANGTPICNGHTAKVHDLLHDLAVHVGKESKLLNVSDDLVMNEGNLRHVSIGPKLDFSSETVDRISDPKTLRTLIFFGRRGIDRKNSLNMLLGRFRMLRTLDLSHFEIDNIPVSVGELIHLRYLDLSHSFMLENLPDSICNLSHLMILKLMGCSSLENLPSNIGQLVSLRQLYVDECDKLVSFPLGLAALTSLVNLDRIIVHPQYGGLRYLSGLNNLCGILKIELPEGGWSNAIEDAKQSNMPGKNNLRGMLINWVQNTEGGSKPCKIVKEESNAVLEALEPHKYLEFLNIVNFAGDKLSSWVRTHHIKELFLYECDVDYIDEDDNKRSILSFPSLKILQLKKLYNLKGWWRHVPIEAGDPVSRQSCLSNVVSVVIEDCPNLTETMPMFGKIESLCVSNADVKLVTEFLDVSNVKQSFSRYHRLKELSLRNIKGLSSLPEGWIRHLAALQSLKVHLCPDLRRMSSRSFSRLTTLEILELSNYLEEPSRVVVEEDDDESDEVGMPWKAIQRLRVLRCSVTYNQYREGLKYLTSLEILSIKIRKPEDAEVEHEDFDSDEFPLQGLRKLRTLEISFGGRATCRLANGIQCLDSLEELVIRDCEELYLSWTTLFITMKLRSLSIFGVRSVINVEDVVSEEQSHLSMLTIGGEANWMHDMPWRMLGTVASLKLQVIQESEHLPQGIQHLDSLRKLEIDGCEELISLPDWMRNHTSLQGLLD